MFTLKKPIFTKLFFKIFVKSILTTVKNTFCAVFYTYNFDVLVFLKHTYIPFFITNNSFFFKKQQYNIFSNYIQVLPTKKVLLKQLTNAKNYLFKFWYSFSSYYQFFKTTFLSLLLSVIVLIILLDYFTLNFVKQLAIWLVLGLLVFWLFSSFNFFLKRYKYGKFTSATQRFWKRTNAYFWIIEGFLFFLFFYYFLNSSQEPLYFYDESALNQNHLLNSISYYQSTLLLLLISYFLFFLTHRNSNLSYRQTSLFVLILTVLFTYIYLLESYQVYYILTVFFENVILFDIENNSWVWETENPRFRTKIQYFLIALILKYWHFVFLYLSWVFIVVKSFEKKLLSHTLLGLLLQNTLLLIILNILFTAQWLKWLFKRFSETAYYWFFCNTNDWSIVEFFNEFFFALT